MARDELDMEEPGADRSLWRRCCAADAPEDDAARLLDLAALADGRLDDDERERVTDLLARDPAAAADVAAARAPTADSDDPAVDFARVAARATALVPQAGTAGGRVVAFPGPMRRRALPGIARWASLAAAVAIAGWLGFAMGSDTGRAFSQPGQSGGDGFLNDVLEPGLGIWRDLGEGQRT